VTTHHVGDDLGTPQSADPMRSIVIDDGRWIGAVRHR